MRTRIRLMSLIVFLFIPALHAADWPQLQNNPQRTGYSSETLGAVVSAKWSYGFSPERLHPQTQPVIAGGKVFIGTAMGTFYAFDAVTGGNKQTFKAGGPILHSAAVSVSNGLVVFGAMDGKVYGLRTSDLTQVWAFVSGKRTGFSTAVLMVEDKATPANTRFYIPNRDGTVYCLDPGGNQVWQTKLAAPVLMSPAYDKQAGDPDGKVFVGAMDMRVYALDAVNGSVLWQSAILRGASFKDYHPVATKGYVLVRPMVLRATDKLDTAFLSGPGPITDFSAQDQMVATFNSSPDRRNLRVLNQSDGQEPFAVPHWVTIAMHGAVCPPAVDGDGLLIIPAIYSPWPAGWARLDLTSRHVVEGMSDVSNFSSCQGCGNPDENMAVSAAGRLAFITHIEEANAQFTGFWNLDTKTWTRINPYTPDLFFMNNAQGGGTNAMAISNQMLYHNSVNNLNARTIQ